MKKLKYTKAIELRKRGFSVTEISVKLKVAKSTVSLWTRAVQLSALARQRIERRLVRGRQKGLAVRNAKEKELRETLRIELEQSLKKIAKSSFLNKLFCALLYWCEGEKGGTAVAFTNSNPTLTSTFMKLFRSAFEVDEKKFRAILHLHSYHNEQIQKEFWSNVTGIPQNHFYKTYWKINGGKNKRLGYPGCASIRYNDHRIAKELFELWTLFSKHGGLI